ncbi:hypothetical protein ABI125_07175 [Tamlana crocina]|uniref:Gliding motility-associated protein GldM N-terminal domain-containing protein n=1 Tax=Tamlana crocina TaxID=393006 RepID=A0ABX1DE54_9FLAO|nr:hypothetical protein [Tamlana crocina]NJX14923.1 hypothetical protein [Tamlana crocina]
MEEQEKDTAKFPHKTLIWAVFGLIAIFLFKPELKLLISHAENVSVFGVEITASREKVRKLHDSIQNFESTIADLSNQLTNQQDKLKNLDKLKTKLENDLAECPKAKEASALLNKQVRQLSTTNHELINKSDQLAKSSILTVNPDIFKLNTYTVKLVLPSNMIGADIYVDSKKATVVKTSGVYATVRVIKKNDSHKFDIKLGNKRCSTQRLITENNTQVPIICN